MTAERSRLTLLHLSDLHATESGVLYSVIQPLVRLAEVAKYALDQGLGPDAVIITGDLAQRNNSGAYPLIERACRELEACLGAPVMTVLGNHDDPEAAKVLTGHKHGHVGVEKVRGTRIVRLNSRTRELGPEQLEWLREVLDTPSENGTILALHHAPAASPLPALSGEGLADAAELLRAIDGRDVKAVLAGHYHHTHTAFHGNIPIFVAPALSYHQMMNVGPSHVAGHNASWFSLVEFTASGARNTPIELAPGAPLFMQAATG